MRLGLLLLHGCLLSELDTHLRTHPLTSACLFVSCLLLKVTHGRLLSELEALETAMHEAEQEGSARARKPKDQTMQTAVEVRCGQGLKGGGGGGERWEVVGSRRGAHVRASARTRPCKQVQRCVGEAGVQSAAA